MRKSRYQMKRFAVMLLSACLVLQQGAVSALAAETGRGAAEEAAVESDVVIAEEAETASASDAVSAETASAAAKDAEKAASAAAENAGSAAEEATSSNAMFDEEGFLLDGEVISDVEEVPEPEAEIIDPEMKTELKTEVIGKKDAETSNLLDLYGYTQDDSRKIVTLGRYYGSEEEIHIPATIMIDGVEYQVAIGKLDYDYSIWGGRHVKSIEFDAGVILPSDMSYFFYYCSDLEFVDMSNLDTSSVTNMKQMFGVCRNLPSVDLSNFDTSNVTDISYMFHSCFALQSVDLSSFDTSKVTTMGCMFYNCENLTSVDVSSFDTSKVTSMSCMFYGCQKLKQIDLSNFCTANVTKMNHMFYYCTALTSLDLTSFDTSNVTDMKALFQFCNNLQHVDLSSFDTSKVTLMDEMFYSGYGLSELDLSNFDMTSVTSGVGMFYDCTNLVRLHCPVNCKVDVSLQNAMQTQNGVLYTQLPKNESKSLLLTKPDEYIHVTGVKINTTARTIKKGSTFQLKAWPQPTNATNKEVQWSGLGYENIATVDQTGLVTGVSEGKAVILVRTIDGNFRATCTIFVGTPVTGLKINTTAKVVAPGKTFQMAAWPQPSTASNKKVFWTSSNTDVATVDSAGLVTGIKNGTAVITAKTEDGGYTQTCTITVGIPVTSVKINATSKIIAPGKTFQLAAWPQPTNAVNKAVTWSSSNTAVATVSSTGLVTAVKTGTATITVKTVDGGKTATCAVSVKVPVTSVKINATAKTIAPGATFQLAAWPQPSNATNKAVTWSSSNTAVAKVSSTGKVTAVKAGTATITVKTADGGKTATCKITVKVPVTSVKLNATAKTLNVGKTFQLAAWPQPSNATNKAVTWTSSNTTVATVSSTGVVTAKKKGTATITVKTADGGKTATCKITVQ